jgi:putative ABC transport system permease protein
VSRLLPYLVEAFEAIWRNRTRSLLTMLGMIIGTSSIIAVLGISKAASGGINATLNSFGDQGISISPDPNQDDPHASSPTNFRMRSRTSSRAISASSRSMRTAKPTARSQHRRATITATASRCTPDAGSTLPTWTPGRTSAR